MSSRTRQPFGGLIAYLSCIAAVAWLAVGNFQFRQSLRDSLRPAYSQLSNVEVNGVAGKVLNLYYEDVYGDLPNTLLPGVILLVSSTVLFITGRRAGR